MKAKLSVLAALILGTTTTSFAGGAGRVGAFVGAPRPVFFRPIPFAPAGFVPFGFAPGPFVPFGFAPAPFATGGFVPAPFPPFAFPTAPFVRGPVIVGGPPVIVGGPAPIVASAFLNPFAPRPVFAPAPLPVMPRPPVWVQGMWVQQGVVTRYIPGHWVTR